MNEKVLETSVGLIRLYLDSNEKEGVGGQSVRARSHLRDFRESMGRVRTFLEAELRTPRYVALVEASKVFTFRLKE